MSFFPMRIEIRAERLLLVALEDPQYGDTNFRHIRATVIRRAVPHKLRADCPEVYDGTGVEVWNDGHAPQRKGYRNAGWILSKTSGLYVDGLQLRGQINVGPISIHDGRPYGNNVEFATNHVCQDTARAISDFYTKYNKFFDKNNIAHQDSDFYLALYNLSLFLKISKIVFLKNGVSHLNLSEIENFEEMNLAQAKVRIDEILAPFYRIPQSR